MCLCLPVEITNGVTLHCGSISNIMASNHRSNGLNWKAGFFLIQKMKKEERNGKGRKVGRERGKEEGRNTEKEQWKGRERKLSISCFF